MSTMTATTARSGGMTKDERFVILASSLGTVFEWYDFYLYGSLASIIGAQFFSAYPPATRDIFALLAFAAAAQAGVEAGRMTARAQALRDGLAAARSRAVSRKRVAGTPETCSTRSG